MSTQDIRRKFLNYFKENGHAIIPSSPVLPHDDPTLLFTNAGMNQFKDVFLGQSVRDYKRATTSQKCIRVGGKHNDLDNVGHTSRHLTLFEMLGNFSFGDYFKEDAIKFAWEVSTKVFGFDPNRIWPTVFREDDEAFEIWKKYVPAERITRFDEAENFWAMGDTGPCGPCSELLYDRGPSYGDARNPKEDKTGERYLEFWNLVFMQFNRTPDGKMHKLPKPCVDTGAGLERIISLLMEVDNVFETDVLGSLVKQVEVVSGKKYERGNHAVAPAFHVIADHLRCLSFAIADGIVPSNVERGYVLRKVLRRAVRYGRQLGMDKPFMAEVLPTLVELMGPDYPELKKNQARIAEILTSEEEAFIRTLRRGGNILNSIIEHAHRHGNRITGEDAFKLKDTYGFPLEEITLIAKDSDLTVDLDRYKELEEEARVRSKSVHKVTHQIAGENLFEEFAAKHGTTRFLGYTEKQSEAKVVGIVVGNSFVDAVEEGQEAVVILNQSPFYAEMGGQIGDIGRLAAKGVDFKITDTQSPFKGITGHVGILEKGKLAVGDIVIATIEGGRRQRIENNHTATHLLHWALQKVLGEHIKQGGSVVEPERLRFDFSHHKALTTEEVRQIEDLVNAKIRANTPVQGYEIAYADAQKRDDIKQFFGEKYGEQVRVIDINESKELCGGTHTKATGNIGLFRISKEGSIAAGMRRIEAVTGIEAEAMSRAQEDHIAQIAELLKSKPHQLTERIEKLLEEYKTLETQLKSQQKGKIADLAKELAQKIELKNGTPLLVQKLALDADEFKLCTDEVVEQLKSGVVVLGNVIDGKCQLIARVSDDLIQKGIKANEIIKVIAPIVNGGGGGKADSAQAGGKNPERIDEALMRAKELV